jgi:hypothetical protein
MGIGSIIGGVASGLGSIFAGNQISNAGNQAANLATSVSNQEGSQLAPWENTSQGALYSLASLLGIGGATPPAGGAGTVAGSTPSSAFSAWTQTPAYQFPLQQSLLALQRSNAARGLLNSGATTKDITQYASGYASQGLNSYLSQLSGLAGIGPQAIEAQANTGLGSATQAGGSLLTGAGAQAAGTSGAIQSMFGSQGGLTPFLNSFNGSSYPTGQYSNESGFLPEQLSGAYQYGSGWT